MASETVHTFCRLCEVMCGLKATVEDGELVKLRGDEDHPVSKGFACNKGLLALDVHRDPDRLDRPQRRSASGWEDVSWPRAVAELSERLSDVIARHGPDSVAMYLGNPNAFNTTAGPAAAMFLLTLGSTRLFSAATQDCANKFTVSEILYGSAGIHPIPDIDRTDHLLIVGSNPRVSKSSFVSLPDPVAAMRGVTERGGTVRFVNPVAVEPDIGPTLQILPDTDAYLLAAMLAEIDRSFGFAVDSYGDRVHNLDVLSSRVSRYPPERVAPVLGVTADEIVALAREFATARSAAIHTSTGVNMGRHGSLAYFLAQMLSLVTGNLDHRGGNYVPARALAPMPAALAPGPESFEETPWGPVRRSNSCLPGALLADWIRSETEPIRALICVAGNPALSFPDGDAVDGALRDLELLVCVDLYRNATGELADFNLPAADWFERADLNSFTQGVQTTPHVQFTRPVVAPHAQRRTEAEIFSMLAGAMGLDFAFPGGTESVALVHDGALAAHGLSVAELDRHDRGLAMLGEATLGTFFDEQILTADGRLDCAPELLMQAFDRADAIFADAERRPSDSLRLITRRTRNTLNSALSNIERLKERGADTNPCFMNPEDAAARGLAAGDRIVVSNQVGKLEAQVGIDSRLRRGVVAMTHGFGHAGLTGLRVASRFPGANVNVLSPGGPEHFEPLSGMAQLTGIPVEIVAVDAT